MREIKFRAWDGEQMIESYEIGIGKFFEMCEGEYEDFKQTENIMQYTGRKDKNDKEIYEGDIVEYSNWIDETGSQFSNILIEDITKIPDIDFEYCKIIGNRFENPELLQKKQSWKQ